jgi:hypothetical protein
VDCGTISTQMLQGEVSCWWMLNIGPCPPVSTQVQDWHSIRYCCRSWCNDPSCWPAMGRPWVCLTFLAPHYLFLTLWVHALRFNKVPVVVFRGC